MRRRQAQSGLGGALPLTLDHDRDASYDEPARVESNLDT